MSNKKPLPIGIDIFEKLINNNCYYIDKTGIIEYLKEKKSRSQYSKELHIHMRSCTVLEIISK